MTTQFIPGRRGIMAVRADAAGFDSKALISELHKTVADFRAELDTQLKQKADVVALEKLDRIDKHVTDLQAEADKVAQQIAAQQIGVGGKPARDPDYNAAFEAYVRKNDIKASLNKGTASEGGYFTPVEWDRTITDKLVLVSPMRQIARVQEIGTGSFSKLFNARGMGSGWVGETAARPETTTPTIGTLTYATGEIYANPSATQQFLDDALVNVEEWIAGEVETEFAYQEGIAFVSGNGTNKPAGFLTYVTGAANAAVHPWGAVLLTTAAAVAAVTSDEIITLVYSLPMEMSGEARFVMNRSTQSAIRKLKDAANNYLWEPSVQAGQPATLFGYPLTEMAAMPNMAASAVPIAFGDFRRGYLIVDRLGVRVLRDPYSAKPYVMFYTTKRVGGGLLNPEAIKALKMAAS